ncbi:MAG TPA: sugar transferase [Acidimicrobiia bacterium]|nr:sugar transferase [Acidimicrobiia bacterium]
MRELLREILSANLAVTGVLLTLAAIAVFFGTVYLLNRTNLGKKLAFLVTGAATFGWMSINSLLFVLYAPRGPRPADFEGLNAFEIRIIPLTFMLAALILFAMFLTALNRFEEEQERQSV